MKTRPDTIDEWVVREVRRTYADLNLRGAGVMDVGANIGAFSDFAFMHGAFRINAYEPDPDNFALAEANVPPGTELHRCALVGDGDDRDTVPFYLAAGPNKGSHSMVPIRGREEIQVPALPFWGEVRRVQPRVIKMDIEGGEYALLTKPLPACVQQVALELHLGRKVWREVEAPRVLALFEDWEMVKAPKMNRPYTVGIWRRR